MEQGSEKPKSYKEEIKKVAALARVRIEQEFSETMNRWPACVESMATYFGLLIENHNLEVQLGEDDYKKFLGNVGAFQSRVDELMHKYPTREDFVPEEIKEEVYQMIEAIGKTI